MAREYRSQITGDPQGRTFGNLVDAAGRVVLEGVSFVPTNVTQEGDKWRAQAANLVANLDEATGAAVLAIDEGQTGAERGTIKVFRSATKPAALPHGRFCLTPNGLFVGNAANLPTPAGPIQYPAPPKVTDDSSKGYQTGNVWTVGHHTFLNLLSRGYLQLDNWNATSNAIRFVDDTVLLLWGSPSSVTRTLSNSIQPLEPGHKYYIMLKITMDTSYFSALAWLNDFGISRYNYTGNPVIYHGIYTPSSVVVGAQMHCYLTSAYGPSGSATLSVPTIIDLTGTLGAGNEYTLEEAYNVFSGYTNYQDSFFVGTPAAYICVSPAPGAANWKQLALEV